MSGGRARLPTLPLEEMLSFLGQTNLPGTALLPVYFLFLSLDPEISPPKNLPDLEMLRTGLCEGTGRPPTLGDLLKNGSVSLPIKVIFGE